MVVPFDFNRYREIGLVEYLKLISLCKLRNGCGRLTLKELWTKVSSRSKTRHLRPLKRGSIGGNKNFCCGGSATATFSSSATLGSSFAIGGGGGGGTV